MEKLMLTKDGMETAEMYTPEWKLKHLISILKNIKEKESFQMGAWWVKRSHLECGFAGCALGWATTDPIFEELGLHRYTSPGTNSAYVKFESWTNYIAAETFFEISRDDAHYLFDPSHYVCINDTGYFVKPTITIGNVIKHIEEVLKDMEETKMETIITQEGMINFPRTREEKLNHLIHILKRVPSDGSFNMGTWWKKDKDFDCGFAGCACGWASVDPIFNSMGFHVVPSEDEWCIQEGYIKFEEHKDFSAAVSFFELSYEEGEFLFSPEEYFINTIDGCLVKAVTEELYQDMINNGFFITYNEDDEGNPINFSEDTNVPPEMVIKHIELVRDNPNTFLSL